MDFPTIIIASFLTSTAMCFEPAIVFMDGERFELNPLPAEMRIRTRNDGSKYEVIPGSVGLGYIVEELNARIIRAKSQGNHSRCYQLQQLCQNIEKQRQMAEMSDTRYYGSKIKQQQAKPLSCNDIVIEADVNEDFWLCMGSVTALILCMFLYQCGKCYKSYFQISKYHRQPMAHKAYIQTIRDRQLQVVMTEK